MQIDHIALYTRDLERLCEFYTKYFDGTAGKLYQNEETGTQACFVSFADGARLEIVTRPQFEDAEHSRLWTGWAHTSFKAGTRENVDALTEQMRSEGYEITELEPCEMLYFQSQPFETEEEFFSLIGQILRAPSQYNPQAYGLAYAYEIAPSFNFGGCGGKGAKIAVPVRRLL